MISFFIDVNKFILYFISQMIKIYIFIGLIITLLMTILIIIYKLLMPDQFHEFMAKQFINMCKDNPEDYCLTPNDVTNGDIMFLCILFIITMIFIWPYGIMCLISDK